MKRLYGDKITPTCIAGASTAENLLLLVREDSRSFACYAASLETMFLSHSGSCLHVSMTCLGQVTFINTEEQDRLDVPVGLKRMSLLCFYLGFSFCKFSVFDLIFFICIMLLVSHRVQHPLRLITSTDMLECVLREEAGSFTDQHPRIAYDYVSQLQFAITLKVQHSILLGMIYLVWRLKANGIHDLIVQLTKYSTEFRVAC